MRRIALAIAGLLILAVPAFAAPERQGVVTSSAPYTWEGGPGNGVLPTGGQPVRCTPVYECEDTLVEIKEAGDLTALIKAGEGSTDLDVAIFESDSSGTVNADSPTATDPQSPKAEDISTGADAKATARRLQPGFYVIRVRFYGATQGVYTGTASLAVPPPVVEAPPAAPPATPPATSTPKPKKKKASCRAKAKKVKNAKKRKAALKKCKRKRKRR